MKGKLSNGNMSRAIHRGVFSVILDDIDFIEQGFYYAWMYFDMVDAAICRDLKFATINAFRSPQNHPKLESYMERMI